MMLLMRDQENIEKDRTEGMEHTSNLLQLQSQIMEFKENNFGDSYRKLRI